MLKVSGELDLCTAAVFAERARLVADAQPERLVLDLSDLVFADCCGARALAAAVRAVPAGCPVIVRSVHPRVRRLLDLLGLDLECRSAASTAPMRSPRGHRISRSGLALVPSRATSGTDSPSPIRP